MDWARILAYITGTVDQELLSRNEYLVTENRILKRQLKGRLLLSDAERATLGEIGHRLGRKALADVANAAKPDTILGWYPRHRLQHLQRPTSSDHPKDITSVSQRSDERVADRGGRGVSITSSPNSRDRGSIT